MKQSTNSCLGIRPVQVNHVLVGNTSSPFTELTAWLFSIHRLLVLRLLNVIGVGSYPEDYQALEKGDRLEQDFGWELACTTGRETCGIHCNDILEGSKDNADSQSKPKSGQTSKNDVERSRVRLCSRARSGARPAGVSLTLHASAASSLK